MGNIEMFNLETGEKICELGSFNNIISEPETVRVNPLSVNINREISFTLDVEIDPEFIKALTSEPPYKYDCRLTGDQVTGYEQVKKHRKNRINKKWAKKYGYKEILEPFEISMNHCSITPINKRGQNMYEIEATAEI